MAENDDLTTDEARDLGTVAAPGAPGAVPNIVQALAAVAADVGVIPKDDQHDDGRGTRFAYRSIDRIMASVGPALAKHQVVPVPYVRGRSRREKARGANGNLWDHVTLEVEYRFYGPAGDHLTACVVAEGLDNGDKGCPKAMTGAYKTALLQVLGIAGDLDPDAPNLADEGPARPREARRAAPAKKAAPAKAASAKKAAPAKKAASQRPSVADQVAALADRYGPEHAAKVALIMDDMNGVPVSDRKEVKDLFVESFGPPSRLKPEQVADAQEWVKSALAFLAEQTKT